MKKTIFLTLILTLALIACDILNNDDDDNGDGKTFTSVDAFSRWYSELPENTPDAPYKAKLSIKDSNASVNRFNLGLYGALGLIGIGTKYVDIDCSGSTFTSIESQAFRGTCLTGMILPDSVTTIGWQAFSNCGSLTSVTLPANAGFTSIDQEAFSGCSSLKSVTIPASVTSLGGWAFSGCTSLTSVIIPNSVTGIEGGAFLDCTSLKSVTIGSGVTSIGQRAFSGCTSLTGVIIPNSVTIIGDWAFDSCANLTGVTIGNSVTTIGNDAFSGCSSLKSITIPASVNKINYWAFSGCTSLTSVTFEGTITDFGDYGSPFDYDLEDKYREGGIGTYTREIGGSTWTKSE